MVTVMDVWTEYHGIERTVSSSPKLAAVHFAEDKGIEEAGVKIMVYNLYDNTRYSFMANELSYGYAAIDGGCAG